MNCGYFYAPYIDPYMNDGDPEVKKYKVVTATEEELEKKLNENWLDDKAWEVFNVIPTLAFGAKVMGVPLPDKVVYNIIWRSKNAPSD